MALESIFTKNYSKKKHYIIAPFIVVIIGLICFLLSDFLGYKVVSYILLVTVSLLAMFFDIFPVLIAALISALIWDYFFIPPRFTLNVGNNEDTLMLAMYFVVALVNAVLTYKLRQMEKLARQREEKANTIKLYNVLLNSLSHELKTPIATIIGSTDNLLTDGNKLTEENKTILLKEISIASVRLNEQVENLLNMSRLESGYIKPKLDWCDVDELVHSVVNRIEDKSRNHQLIIKVNESLPLFKLDFGLMEQVLYNLLINAINYTPSGTTITVIADCTQQIKGHFVGDDHHPDSKRDSVKNSLILEISDSGIGFPEDEIEQVFDKFYRLKNSKTGGTGLGLSIAKGFVEAHNGTINLTNTQGGGALFVVTIPSEISYLNRQRNE
ncbi:MAG: ATP-binding protein [Bacteroidota bacterium]